MSLKADNLNICVLTNWSRVWLLKMFRGIIRFNTWNIQQTVIAHIIHNLAIAERGNTAINSSANSTCEHLAKQKVSACPDVQQRIFHRKNTANWYI